MGTVNPNDEPEDQAAALAPAEPEPDEPQDDEPKGKKAKKGEDA